VSLRDRLADLCLSHNQDAGALDDLPLDFADDCDLRFCAVILRLSDILDFDRSRSPAGVYAYLGLKQASDPRESSSDVEWRKHLAAGGFKFPARRPGPYPLGFVAGPDTPAVEHDVREFLDVIEAELHECAAVVNGCSDRWRDLPIPDRVKRNNILSKGYKYGEHRFTLDRDQVLQLFMGENLYESPHTFVRELLQNAMDTSRHREFVERNRGASKFSSPPIEIEQWEDEDHYHWVRIKDSGMGMTEQIIRDHFLTVGSSYYQSASFQADLLRYAAGERFTPISRFGIGVLSCFVPGDRVELTTRHIGPDGTMDDAIRLSLSGPRGFYTLQTGRMKARPMPAPSGEEPGYRTEPGTTIAVRLDPARQAQALELETILAATVLAPPVPVELEGVPVGGDPEEILERPWCEPKTHKLGPEIVKEVEAIAHRKLPNGLRVKVVPLDLTSASPSLELRGQLTAIYVSSAVPKRFDDMSLRPYDQGLHLRVTQRGSDTVAIPDELWPAPAIMGPHFRTEGARPNFDGSLVLTHNGIVVPSRYRGDFGFDEELGLERLGEWGNQSGIARGCIALTARLRPDVSVSRDELRSLPWAVHSAINLAMRRALRAQKVPARLTTGTSALNMAPFPHQPLLQEVADESFSARDGVWVTEPIVPVGRSRVSIEEIRRRCEKGQEVRLALTPTLYHWGGVRGMHEPFWSLCVGTLLELHVELAVELTNKRANCFARGVRDSTARTPRHLFPPNFFVSYEGSDALKLGALPLNIAHPFSGWLLGSAERLALAYPGTLAGLRRTLMEHVGDDSTDSTLAAISASAERLRKLDPDLAPAKAIVPTTDDFTK
jgi:hypothetical protein